MIYFSKQTDFYGNTNPHELIKEFNGPLYVYNENIFRQKCKEMANLVDYPNFKANYSIKANSNLHLLKIARSEGIYADAMSPGEIFVLEKAGYKPEEIFYVSNNVSKEEMKFAIDKGITVSVDSLSQIRRFGEINPGGKLSVRFNPGIGAGHHEKVVTAGEKTKFGVNKEYLDLVKSRLKEYNLKLIGINQHIGSLFMEADPYLQAVKNFLEIAEHFPDLEFVDMGGGFGIPYQKQSGQKKLDIKELGSKLTDILNKWTEKYGKKIMIKTEPGRYISAESSILLGNVNTLKQNGDDKYIGTDIGFNVLARPVMYESHHDIEIYRNGNLVESELIENYTIVGNICESGDIITKNRPFPRVYEGDIIGICDSGAYGYSMASNYNNRLRPAEVLINKNGDPKLIRKREILEDLIKQF